MQDVLLSRWFATFWKESSEERGGKGRRSGWRRGGRVWQGATHQVEPRAASREGIVLQRGGSKVGVHHMARLLVQLTHPAGKLAGIGQRGRQEHHAYALGQEDDGLFPHHTSLPVLHVMNLIKDDPSYLSQYLRASASTRESVP